MAAEQNLMAGVIPTDASQCSLHQGNQTLGTNIHPGSHNGTLGCLIWSCDEESLHKPMQTVQIVPVLGAAITMSKKIFGQVKPQMCSITTD